ncbi:hypothetical protein VNI00_007345 [Paramarasmius palmivorus]|uniref:Uncharacterized protein n=1 Tax=Paramarasmius palmivorus TaxID=297713 RepID=A0AAW0D3X0_9AGAR
MSADTNPANAATSSVPPAVTHPCGFTSGTTPIGRCAFTDDIYMEFPELLPEGHKQARALMAIEDEKAKVEVKHIASIVCSKDYTLQLPYFRRVFKKFTDEQRDVLYDSLGPLFTYAIMEYLKYMVFDSDNLDITGDHESPEWDAVVQEQHLVAEREAYTLLPSEIRILNEAAAEKAKKPCPKCGADNRKNYDRVMGQCMSCGHGNDSGKYD